MTEADKKRLELIQDLVGQYMCWYDDMQDPGEMAESLVYTIGEIFNDKDILQTADSYEFPDVFDDSDEDTDDDEFDINDKSLNDPLPKFLQPKKEAWPTAEDLIGDEDGSTATDTSAGAAAS